MKFLLIRFSSIGDIAQTTPVIRCLRQHYPDAEIHFLTKREYEPMMRHNPYLNEVIVLDDHLLTTIARLRQYRYDYIIDLHHNLRTFVIKHALNTTSFSFPKLNIEKWLLTRFHINLLPQGVHLVDRYFEAFALLGVTNDGLGLDYFLGEDETVNVAAELPEGFADGYIGWVIGAKHFTKVFPKEKVVATIQLLHAQFPAARIVLIGGKEDVANGDFIATHTGANVFNACGKYTLNKSVSLVAQADMVIGNDTGLTQIAPAFKKPVISLWGSTSIVFGVAPYLAHQTQGSAVIEVQQLPCRPCTKFGRKECPEGHFRCMRDIEEQTIVNSLSSSIH